MTEEEPHPRFRVRVTGSGPPAKSTREWLPRLGGRYEGLPNVEFGRVLVRGVSFANMAFDYFEAEGTTFAGCDFSGRAWTGPLDSCARPGSLTAGSTGLACLSSNPVKRASMDVDSPTQT